MDDIIIEHAATEASIARCHPVMAELRDYSMETFVAQVMDQIENHRYQLVYLEDNGVIEALAGYRTGVCLAWGKYIYVEDLVTSSSARSKGQGHRLMQWLLSQARRTGCRELHLDSGVQRFAAHRFYLRERMKIASHHFSIKLAELSSKS